MEKETLKFKPKTDFRTGLEIATKDLRESSRLISEQIKMDQDRNEANKRENKNNNDAPSVNIKDSMCDFLGQSFPPGTWQCGPNRTVIENQIFVEADLKCLKGWKDCESYKLMKSLGLEGHRYDRENKL